MSVHSSKHERDYSSCLLAFINSWKLHSQNHLLRFSIETHLYLLVWMLTNQQRFHPYDK